MPAPRRDASGAIRLNETTIRRSRKGAAASAPTAAPVAAPVEADPLLQLLSAMQDVDAGDFSVRLPLHWEGVPGKLAAVFNRIVTSNRRLAEELARVGQKVGREGQTRQRVVPAIARARGPGWSIRSTG